MLAGRSYQGGSVKQKTYSCELRFRGNQLMTVALSPVTRHELKMLAYIHGAEAIPPQGIKFLGEAEILNPHKPGDDKVVRSEMEELKRLAKKYDVLADLEGVNRGRRNVEACFNTTLDDFEDVMAMNVDPRARAEEAMIAAELEAQRAAAIMEQPEGGAIQPPPKDEKKGTLGLGGVFKSTASEGVKP